MRPWAERVYGIAPEQVIVGHQVVSGMWGDREHASLTQDPSNVARAVLSGRYPRLINPGLKKDLDSSGNLKDVNTAVVGGLRPYVRF